MDRFADQSIQKSIDVSLIQKAVKYGLNMKCKEDKIYYFTGLNFFH